jgi:hypothetical protein
MSILSFGTYLDLLVMENFWNWCGVERFSFFVFVVNFMQAANFFLSRKKIVYFLIQ